MGQLPGLCNKKEVNKMASDTVTDEATYPLMNQNKNTEDKQNPKCNNEATRGVNLQKIENKRKTPY